MLLSNSGGELLPGTSLVRYIRETEAEQKAISRDSEAGFASRKARTQKNST